MKLNEFLGAASEVTKAVILPDIEAWKDIASGEADAADYASAALDLTSFIPGGFLARGAIKGGRATYKVAEAANDMKKWDRLKLYHGTKNTLQGTTIKPAAEGFRGTIARHSPDGKFYRDEPKVRVKETKGDISARKVRELEEDGRPNTNTLHTDYAFATPNKDYASFYATMGAKEGSRPALVKVVPIGNGRKDLLRTRKRAAEWGDHTEYMAPKGFKVIEVKPDPEAFPDFAKNIAEGKDYRADKLWEPNKYPAKGGKPNSNWSGTSNLKLSGDGTITISDLRKHLRDDILKNNVNVAKVALPSWTALGTGQASLNNESDTFDEEKDYYDKLDEWHYAGESTPTGFILQNKYRNLIKGLMDK